MQTITEPSLYQFNLTHTLIISMYTSVCSTCNYCGIDTHSKECGVL